MPIRYTRAYTHAQLLLTPPAAARAQHAAAKLSLLKTHTPQQVMLGSVQRPAWASLVEDHVKVQASAAAEVDEEQEQDDEQQRDEHHKGDAEQ